MLAQEVILAARQMTQDTYAPYRYGDPDMLADLSRIQMWACRRRRSLCYGTGSYVAPTALTLASQTLVVATAYCEPLAHYLAHKFYTAEDPERAGAQAADHYRQFLEGMGLKNV